MGCSAAVDRAYEHHRRSQTKHWPELWRSDSKIVSSGARQRTGLVITGPVAGWPGGLGGWLEGGFLAGELFELADQGALPALAVDA